MEKPHARTAHTAQRDFQRTYQACIPCRNRKAKCELGSDGQPPCGRCRRQHQECAFTTGRSASKRSRQEDNNNDLSPLARDPSTRSMRSRTGEYSQSDGNVQSQFLDHATVQSPGTGQLATEQAVNNRATTSSSSFQRQRSPTSASGLAPSVLRTVISSGNDALNILFEAASHDTTNPTFDSNPTDGPLHQQMPPTWASASPPVETHASDGTPGTVSLRSHHDALPQPMDFPPPSAELLRLWGACRFVTMGWVTAKDAILYIDLFFHNMAPLSPILTDYYASHNHHYELITQEPMLCCTILLLSTRYHVLPGLAGMSKSYFLHNRLWKHWQEVMMRVTFGQEKGIETSLRTVGTIESLLLMCEWHPRSIHFPPEGGGWDSSLLVRVPDLTSNPEEPATPSNQWLEEVIQPARRSDRMSWMLLGSAISLAHEIGIFDFQSRRSDVTNGENPDPTMSHHRRRSRAQKLLHVFTNHLASRLGCTSSVVPQSMAYSTVLGFEAGSSAGGAKDEWDSFIDAWIALTKLLKSVTDVFFPSAAVTREHLLSGRYIGLLEHFRPLLAQWREKHLDNASDLKDTFREILFIEYQFLKVFINSLGMQAVVERTLANANAGAQGLKEALSINVQDADFEFIQEVISACSQILEKVSTLAESGTLRFSPVRFYLRATSSSVFLLKALSLGVHNTKLQASLDILDRSIQALKACTLDDMHLAPRYASLLEVHVTSLRRHFMVSASNQAPSQSHRMARHPSASRPWGGADEAVDLTTGGSLYVLPRVSAAIPSFDPDIEMHEFSADDWLSLPFDPSMAPFPLDGNLIFPGQEGGELDFVWNLSSV